MAKSKNLFFIPVLFLIVVYKLFVGRIMSGQPLHLALLGATVGRSCVAEVA